MRTQPIWVAWIGAAVLTHGCGGASGRGDRGGSADPEVGAIGGSLEKVHGVGQWVLGETARSAWEGTCEAGPVFTTSCEYNPREETHLVRFGSQPGFISASFAGDTPEGVLMELRVAVRSCRVTELMGVLEEDYGPVQSDGPESFYWSADHVFVAVDVGQGDGTCRLTFIGRGQPQRRDELKRPTLDSQGWDEDPDDF